MPKTTPEQNKQIVLEAFDTLFNKRDYAAAERFWSPQYIQHSLDEMASSTWSGPPRTNCGTRTSSSLRKAITSLRTDASAETEGLQPGSPSMSCALKTAC
jgi:hypothetical protein